MKNPKMLHLFLSSSVYIYFANKLSGYFLEKIKDKWNGVFNYTCDIIYYITAGEIDICINGISHRMQAGEMLYIPANTNFERTIVEGAPIEKYYVSMNLSFGKNGIPDIFQFPNIIKVKDNEQLKEIFESLIKHCRTDTLTSAIAANADALRLISFFLEESGAEPIIEQKNDEMQTIIQYINTNLHQNFTVAELAHQSGYSVAQFTRKFKKQVGLSPSDYIVKMKINHAKKRLENLELSISSIAEELGYNDSGYFGKVFKAKTGVSPNTYRKKRMWRV